MSRLEIAIAAVAAAIFAVFAVGLAVEWVTPS
jgi:hypothetical protein